MKQSSLTVLKGFLISLSPKEQKNLKNFLSQKINEKLEKLFSKTIEKEDFYLDNLIKDIHYSWFIDFLSSLSKEDQNLYISFFEDEKIRKNLLKNFKLKKEISLSNIVKQFIKKKLIENIFDENILPKKYIKSDLSFLLNFSKQELIKIIDFLSLFDIAKEIKKIVNKKTLQKIYTFLSPGKQKFLFFLANYKESFSFPSLELEKISEDKEIFHSTLHKRGLYRFALSLANQEKSFIWHITRTLDTGRGKMIEQITEKRGHENILKKLSENILKTITIIKKEREI